MGKINSTEVHVWCSQQILKIYEELPLYFISLFYNFFCIYEGNLLFK